ncbi:MAG: ribosome maturation factor RimM [Holosporaceae bacterium]|nr:ribosome maturation factor RimM [Holosporaceae bacterium]
MVEILRITGAFGVRGMVRAVPFSNNLCDYKKIFDKNGNCFEFRVVKFLGGDRIAVAIDGVCDRNAAEALKGEVFYIQKNDLPKTGNDEFYFCDLIGKNVKIVGSDIFCNIINIENFGAGDLIELSHEGAAFLVPFTRENFPDSDNQILMTREAFDWFKV